MGGIKKKVLLIYGDPNHSNGKAYRGCLERQGFHVTLDETRGTYRDNTILPQLLSRTKPDIAVVGSHLDPDHIVDFEEANVPVIMLSRRSDEELARDPRIIVWKASPVLKGIVNKGERPGEGFQADDCKVVANAIHQVLDSSKQIAPESGKPRPEGRTR